MPLLPCCTEHMSVESYFFIHKCKVKPSIIDCSVRQLQEMRASINKICLIDISINAKPSNIISTNAGTVPSHALHISVYLF